MSTYHYQALHPKGRACKGMIEAESERQARRLLRDQGLIPTHVKLFKKRTFPTRRPLLSTAALALFTRQLATLLAAGLPIDESLHSVAAQSEQNNVRQLIVDLRSKIVEGYSLAQAMGNYPDAFPELYRATVSAGEQTGRLDLILEKLADHTEKQQNIRQKVQHALIYPLLMMTLSGAIVGFLLAFVVPKIMDVFQSSGQALPVLTRLLLSFSSFLKQDGWLTLGGLLALMIGFNATLKTNTTVRMRYHRFLLRLPLLGRLIRTINIARYMHTFGMLFHAGVSVLEAMRVSSSLIHHKPIQAAFEQASVRVREGVSIGQALKDTSYLPPMASHLIASGEKSGQLATMMERAAQQLDHEVQQTIDTALTLLEPLIILLMGGVVLFIVLSILLPIFSMEQLV